MTRLNEGLIFAWQLDGQGGGRRLGADDLDVLSDIKGPLWVHLARDKNDSVAWLEHHASIPRDIRELLLVEDTRPRCEAVHDGLLINLRGVNLNPDAEPDDMLALRLWARGNLVVTLRRHRIMAAEDLSNSLASGRGPKDQGSLIVGLADRLTERMAPTVANLDDAVDLLESEVGDVASDVGALPELRKTAATLRRFVAPQQLALSRLASVSTPMLSDAHRIEIRHTLDVVTRLVEDLDHIRERTDIVDDLMRQRHADQMTKATYRLSLVATLFLPLGFLTGLLGINVGGIPGTDIGWAFWAVSALLGTLGLLGWWLLRRFQY